MAVSWQRRIWKLALPLIATNVSLPLLGAVDTAVVGHLDDPRHLGAVAVGALIVTALFWLFGFLRMTTTGLAAQAVGANDADEVRAVLLRALVLALGLGTGLILLQHPLSWLALELMQPSTEVRELGASYIHIRIWSAPAVLAGYALVGWFLGIQRPAAGLIISLVMNGINIVLDLWFVMGLGWGVAGVAWASLIAEVSALGLWLWLLRRQLLRLGGRWRLRALRDSELGRMVHINGDIFLRTLCLIGAFYAFTSVGARQGDVVLAANAVLLNFLSITSHVLDAFAHATEALAGEALGERNRRAFRAVVVTAGGWALAFAAGFSLVYAIFGENLVALLTDLAEVRATAALYLPWVVATPLVAVWSYQLDGIFLGATRSRAMRNSSLLSVVIYAFAVALFVTEWQNHGLWLALMILFAARAVTLGAVYPGLERSVTGEAVSESSKP